jgi:hypothetical protein
MTRAFNPKFSLSLLSWGFLSFCFWYWLSRVVYEKRLEYSYEQNTILFQYIILWIFVPPPPLVDYSGFWYRLWSTGYEKRILVQYIRTQTNIHGRNGIRNLDPIVLTVDGVSKRLGLINDVGLCIWLDSAQAVSCRPLTAEALVRARVSPCGICGGQRGTGTRFSPGCSVFSYRYHSTVALHTHVSSEGWSVSPIVA